MKKVEKEIEFLKIEKHYNEVRFREEVDNYKHAAVYLLALVVGISGILFSLGDIKTIPFILFGGLITLFWRWVVVLKITDKLNDQGKKIRYSMDKRFEKLGVNINAIEKEVKLI